MNTDYSARLDELRRMLVEPEAALAFSSATIRGLDSTGEFKENADRASAAAGIVRSVQHALLHLAIDLDDDKRLDAPVLAPHTEHLQFGGPAAAHIR